MKTVLITGSSRGIGRETAIYFAQQGWNVIIHGFRHPEKLESLKNEILEENVSCLSFCGDISDPSFVDEMIKQSLLTFSKIDGFVNNAGIAIDKEFEDRTVEDWKRTLEVNTIGTFLVSKYASENMLKNKSGKIINVSSTNGINTFFPSSIDYDASKAAIINLTYNLAIQFSPYINVNAVAPGWVNTEMNKELPKELIKEETEKIYKKRFADPEEIAKVICFLASEDAEYINSTVIKVDGGK